MGSRMDRTELVLGSGEVFFDAFAPGTRTLTGERYIGNTPTVTINASLDVVTGKASRKGIKYTSLKEVVGDQTMIMFVTDNMSVENMRDWVGGDVSATTISGDSYETEDIVLVPGRFYQLGLAAVPMIGHRNLFGLGARNGSNFIHGLYIDEPNGRIGVPLDRTDLIGVTATVEYEIKHAKSAVITVSRKPVKGALRFISHSSVGLNTNFYFPHVVLTPRDQLQLKGDDWRTLTFEAEAMAPMIMYQSHHIGRSPGEAALIADGLDPSRFVVFEGVLNDTVNT